MAASLKTFGTLAIVISCAAIPIPSHAQRSNGYSSRAYVEQLTKNLCVNFWTESSERKDLLSKIATLSEMCECVTNEVMYALPNQLIPAIDNAMLDMKNKTPGAHISIADADAALDKQFTIYEASRAACARKLSRR